MSDGHASPASGRQPPAAGQLKWRCRRGMRELDVLLERYLQERYPSAPAAEQQAFAALLELPDPQLFAYVVRREVPEDPDWAHVIARLLNAADPGGPLAADD
jgi:antitoxin CptB